MENNFISLVEGYHGDGVFKFGKHKGKSFVEVATSDEVDYFMWLWQESNPKYKTTWAHDTSWAKHNGYKLIELLPKEEGKYQNAIFLKEPKFHLDTDLKHFIQINFEKLSEESKKSKERFRDSVIKEILDSW